MSQNFPVREQLRSLAQMQEVDLRIDALRQKKEAIPLALRELETALAQATQDLNLTQEKFSEVEKLERQTRAAIELNNERLARANEKLSAVSNSQEFNAVNKEIDQLKKMNVELEEQLKQNDEKISQAKSEIGEKEENLAKAREALNAKKEEFDVQAQKLDEEMTRMEGERSEFLGKIEKRILSLYDRIRRARSGVGIVPAIGGRCKGCNMTLPPQLFNELQRREAFHQCPSCQRLLFVPGGDDEEELNESGHPRKEQAASL